MRHAACNEEEEVQRESCSKKSSGSENGIKRACGGFSLIDPTETCPSFDHTVHPLTLSLSFSFVKHHAVSYRRAMYRHAWESVLSYCSLKDLASSARISRTTVAAVQYMAPACFCITGNLDTLSRIVCKKEKEIRKRSVSMMLQRHISSVHLTEMQYVTETLILINDAGLYTSGIDWNNGWMTEDAMHHLVCMLETTTHVDPACYSYMSSLVLDGVRGLNISLLARALQMSVTLTSINLQDNGLDNEDATHLADALTHNQSITFVDVSYNSINSLGITSFADMLCVNKSIKAFNFAANPFGCVGFSALASMMGTNKTLTYINVAEVVCLNIFKAPLISALSSHTTMTSITSLYDTELVACIEHALETNSHVQLLDFSHMYMADSVVDSLAAALSVNTSITYINLCGNSITNAGCITLARALRSNKHITYVNLSDNLFGSRGVDALASAVAQNRMLLQVDIHGIEIGEQGTKSLTNGLAINNSRFDHRSRDRFSHILLEQTHGAPTGLVI